MGVPRRRPRKTWMRLIPHSKHLECANCKVRFLSIFGGIIKLSLTRLRKTQGILQTNLTNSTQSPRKEKWNRSIKIRKSLTSVKVSLVILGTGIFFIIYQYLSPIFTQFLRVTSPHQDGLLIQKPTNSPEEELVLNRKNFPKPQEKKEITSVPLEEGKSSIANIRAISGPPATLESLAIPTQPTQVKIRKGENLFKVISKYYPKHQQIALIAIMLANPAISKDYKVFPGQTITLPQLDPTDNIFKLQDNLYYRFYGRFSSENDLDKSKFWLNEYNIKYLVWNAKESKNKTIHLVIFGGYEHKDDLKIAFQIIKTKLYGH
jgi:hypothetical protein